MIGGAQAATTDETGRKWRRGFNCDFFGASFLIEFNLKYVLVKRLNTRKIVPRNSSQKFLHGLFNILKLRNNLGKGNFLFRKVLIFLNKSPKNIFVVFENRIKKVKKIRF